ncbi:MAG TPA: hypothetical protein ENI92_01385 [Bacteroidetes bacterium]|nr:hypothetical protein [Bacteroidota bacterium]
MEEEKADRPRAGEEPEETGTGAKPEEAGEGESPPVTGTEETAGETSRETVPAEKPEEKPEEKPTERPEAEKPAGTASDEKPRSAVERPRRAAEERPGEAEAGGGEEVAPPAAAGEKKEPVKRRKGVRVLLWLFILLALAALAVAAVYIRGGRVKINTVTVEINAPIDQVFAYITEPAKLRQWIDGYVDSIPLTGDMVGVGSRSIEVMVVQGMRQEMPMEITGWNPPESLETMMRSQGFTKRVRYSLSESNGVTRVEHMLASWYKGVRPRLFAGPVTREAQKKLEADFATLKRVVEAAPRPDEGEAAGGGTAGE